MIAVAAIVALAGAVGWLYWNRVELTRAADQPRRGWASLAAEQIPKVFGYDYQTVERSLTDAYGLLTPDYRHEFEDRANKDIIPRGPGASGGQPGQRRRCRSP